ncbi:hypothetical protein MRX96_036023 [Rhipicephalus microplus]
MELPSLRRYTGRRLLAHIGMKHEKRSRNLLRIDRDDIANWRNRYLCDVELYWAEGPKDLLHGRDMGHAGKDPIFDIAGERREAEDAHLADAGT